MGVAAPAEEELFQRAMELDEADRSAEAANLLAPLAARRDNPRYLLAYASYLRRAGGDWKECVYCLQMALSIEPPYFVGGTRLFLADLLIQNGQKVEALEQWRIVAKMPPDGTGWGAVPDEAIVMLRKHDV
jgi:hypothetical protein